jgi:SAM-dependent methyltransferase
MSYSKFAEFYDAAHHFKDYDAESAYVVRFIDGHCSHATKLLELACGTGLFLERLQKRFTVEGLDATPEMLAVAARRLPGVALHEGDMVRFDLQRQFDVVCCLFRSIAFAKTRENLVSAVCCMAAHLAPGGLLLIEPFFTPETYWVDRVTLNEFKSDELKIAWMYVSEREGRLGRLNNHFLVGTPHGVRHITELHELGLFDRADFQAAFDAASLDLNYDPEGPTRVGMYWAVKRKG